MTSTPPKPKVFFLPWDRRSELIDLLEACDARSSFQRNDLVAVKIHFGERGGDGHIKPEWIRPALKMLWKMKTQPFLTDTGTIYHGARSNAASHLMVAAEHGFTQSKLQTPIIIADGLMGDDYDEIPIPGKHFQSVKIATGIRRADAMLVLSHFKGHLLCGFGGAVKNLGMGCGARLGKFEMHSSSSPTLTVEKCIGCGACITKCAHDALTLVGDTIRKDDDACVGCGECIVACPTAALAVTWNEGAAAVQERLAEYALGAVADKRALYLNFVNHITPNCDCMGMKEKPLCADVGILASLDPVAIDQASLDLVIKTGGDVFQEAHPGIDGTVQLAHAEKIGLGNRNYELVTGDW